VIGSGPPAPRGAIVLKDTDLRSILSDDTDGIIECGVAGHRPGFPMAGPQIYIDVSRWLMAPRLRLAEIRRISKTCSADTTSLLWTRDIFTKRERTSFTVNVER